MTAAFLFCLPISEDMTVMPVLLMAAERFFDLNGEVMYCLFFLQKDLSSLEPWEP